MKVLVTYLSNSGNTEKLAKAIFDGVEGEKMLRPMKEVDDTSGYDMLFVGFPVIAKGAPRRAKKFLSRHAQGKKVALFVTHGMPATMDMLVPMLDNCWTAAQGSQLVGRMDCQGKLAGWMASAFRLYPNAEVRRWVRAGGESIGEGHPGSEDLARAKDFGHSLTADNAQTIVG